MSEDQVEKPTTNDVKEEANKISPTQGGVDAADDKDKGVVTEASGGQVQILSIPPLIIKYIKLPNT